MLFDSGSDLFGRRRIATDRRRCREGQQQLRIDGDVSDDALGRPLLREQQAVRPMHRVYKVRYRRLSIRFRLLPVGAGGSDRVPALV
jgi:hypothetical protein